MSTTPYARPPSTHAGAAPVSDRATLRKISRRLIPFMFLLYVVNYLDRINVSFAALGMNQDLGFSATTYGLGAGLFFLGYILCQVPANLFLVRFGTRRWIGSLMIAWGVVAGAMSMIHGVAAFYLLRVLLGITEAGFFPGMLVYLTHWFPARERARAVAQFMAAIPISVIIGGPVSGALLGLGGLGGVAGWRWLFLLEALPAVALGLVTYRYLTDHPTDAQWLEPGEREWLTETLQQEPAAVPGAAASLRSIIGHPLIWTLAGTWMLTNTAGYGMQFWLPQLLKAQSGHSNLVVGLLSAVPGLAAIVAMVSVSAHSDRSGERCLHVAVPLLIASLGLATAAFSRSVPVTLVGFSLAFAGVTGAYGPFWTMVPRCFGGVAVAAAGVAFINSVGNIGGFVGPYVLGLIKDRTQGYAAALLILAVLLLVAGSVVAVLRRSPILLASEESP